MKKQGFTLPELLGIITLLALLALLIIPAVSKNVSKGKRDLYEVQLRNFEKAAKDWMAIHTLELPDENINTVITIGCLKAEGLLEESIENPVTNAQFPNDMVVKIRTESNQLVYETDAGSGSTEEVPLPAGTCKFHNKKIEK